MFLDEKGKKFNKFYGAYCAWDDSWAESEEQRNYRDRHCRGKSEAMLENGDVIKYDENGKIEWIFSPRFG
jgi:hypothetical protein